MTGKRIKPKAALIAAALCLCLCSATAQAKVQFAMEDWGLGGSVKSGMWSPLYIELTSTREDFFGTIQVEVDTGQKVKPLYVKPLELVQNTQTRHWLYFRAPTSLQRQQYGYKFKWRICDARNRAVLENRWQNEPDRVFPAWDSLVAVFGTPNITRAGISGMFNSESLLRVNVQRIYPLTAPDRAIGYESADALIWLNPDPEALATEEQREAIANYVRSGGHLVLGAGTGWQALTGSFLDELLPANPVGTIDVSELPALTPYGLNEKADKAVTIMKLTEPNGEVLMRWRNRPVIVRGTAGAGRVTLVGFDPTKSPFSTLERRAEFWSGLLGLDTSKKERIMPWNLRCASEPILRALNDFPGFKPINFTFVACFMIAYIILIGPVDYFVLKRLKKLHWTWVTFPVIAILCSYIAFALLSSGRVSGFMANAVSIVDARHDGEEISGTTFLTMLSPGHKRYDMRLDKVHDGAILPREYRVAYNPGPSMGLSQSVCLSTAAGRRLDGVLVRIWDAQTFEASWRAPKPALPEVKLSSGPEGLTGEITNHTGFVLHDVAVVFQGKVYQIGSVRMEKTARLSRRAVTDLVKYTAGFKPSSARHAYGYRHTAAFNREQSDQAARWLTLCAYSKGLDGNKFTRFFESPGKSPGTVFDFPRHIALAGLDSPREAVALFSLDGCFADIRFADAQPQLWKRTVVRMRVPVSTRQ